MKIIKIGSKLLEKHQKTIIIILIIIFIISFFASAFYTRNKYIQIYNEGVSLLYEGNHIKAIERFKDIPRYEDYRNISELLDEYYYQHCPYCGNIMEPEL